MLLELTIRDFAIIDTLRLGLAPGLNIMTGETGAGKSIIIDAVDALLGGRVGAEVIRAGGTTSRIEGVFALPSTSDEVWPLLQPLLDEYGFEVEEGYLILSREINANGRSIARINGRAVPVSVLQQVGRALIDVHGQTEHLSLLRVARHLDFLDSYGNLMPLRQRVAENVAALRRVRRRSDELTRDERELARRVDLLAFQVAEIEAAQLRPGEDSELETERNLLANAEKLLDLAQAAYVALHEGSEMQRSALDLLAETVVNVTSVARIDDSVAGQVESLEAGIYQLEEVAQFLRDYRDRIDADPGRLEVVEERLGAIRVLKRKYGATIEDVLAFRDKAQAELTSISTSEEQLEALRAEEAGLLRAIGDAAEKLSQGRRETAQALSQAVERQLADLGMTKSSFEVSVTRRPSPEHEGVELGDGQHYAFDSTGVDSVEFLLAPNPGEPSKPLVKIASGGEISRVMLALKTVLTLADPVPTLIFDEVDAGVGGRTAPVIGRKLWDLSRNHQVVCITHLPQIAGFGDSHFNITKVIEGDRTKTVVSALGEDERVEEIAVMLGGSATQVSRDNAREVIANARRWKDSNGTSGD